MSRFQNQTAWITGASSGIGRALAIELARQGADVAVSARREDRLQEVKREIEALGRRALAVPCDVTSEEQQAEAVARVVRELGQLDVAVANAGMGVGGRFSKLTADDWRRQLDVNVVGVAITARAALPELEKTGGRLGLVGSIGSFVAWPGGTAYCASKFAVRAMALALDAELAGSGVSVTAVYPGLVESEIGQVDNQGTFHPDRPDSRPQKLMWPADRAARSIAKALHRRKTEHSFTGHGKIGTFFGQHAPGLVRFAMSRGPAKQATTDRYDKRGAAG